MENKPAEPVILKADNAKDAVTFFYDLLSNERNRFEQASMSFFEFGKNATITLTKLIEENEKLKAENESLNK